METSQYYFKTIYAVPDEECTERCMVKDNGVMIGSVACQECEHHLKNNMDAYGNISWITCSRGAGRPKGEPKKALGLRVPEKWHEHLTDMVRKELNNISAKAD